MLVSASSIRIEASTVCQLRCPRCPTTRGETERNLGFGFLTLDRFRQITEEGTIERVELSNWGEIFLNPELAAIIEYAHRKQIKLTADNGANLNHVSGEVVDAMAKYRFHRLSCSIDGVTQRSYGAYRRRGVLRNVLRNIGRINRAKRRHASPFPILQWQFVIFGHNERDIPAAKALARRLGMEIVFKLNWAERYFPIRDAELVKRQTGLAAASRSEFHEQTHERYRQKFCCSQLWNFLAINWDGRILGCSVNRWGDFGTVAGSVTAAANNEKMRYARRMLMGTAPARADIPCSRCHNFQHMQREGNWITPEQIESARRERLVAGNEAES